MTILFPCEYDNINKVDKNFELEYNACKTLNINIALFDFDLFINENKLKYTNIQDNDVLLRSWMFKKEQYINFYTKLNKNIINNPKQYIHCHHFPNVYNNIKDYSIPVLKYFKKSEINKEYINSIISEIDFGFIIKDYVKSEKGTELFHIKKEDKYNLYNIIQKFIQAREPLFNEGIVLKKYVNLDKAEYRVFVFKGEIVTIELNTKEYVKNKNIDIIFIKNIIKNIKYSNFFTIDIGFIDNKPIVIEIGDGQVSGLASFQNELIFYNNLKKLF